MPRGIKVVYLGTGLAPLAGAMGYFAIEGGSLAAALVLGTLMSGGALLGSWWLAGKTGLRREWQRSRSGESARELGEDR
jgi:hypothetical protein